MKSIQTLLIILTAALFFTACEKDETIENYDSISGVLSAGENVTADDLEGMEIYVARFHDTVDFSNITFETTAIDSLDATTLNADGSFTFLNLLPGNYGIALEEGFIFSLDTALVVQLDGKNIKQINKSVEKSIPENDFHAFTFNLSSLSNFSSFIIHNFDEGVEHILKERYADEYNIISILRSAQGTFIFEIFINNPSDNKTDVIVSEMIPVHYEASEAKTKTYNAGTIDIKWVPATYTGMWWWKVINDRGEYVFTDH